MQGHAGKLIVGTFVGRIVVAMKGRFHPYEGTLFRIGKFPGKLVQIKHLAILRIPGRDADRISGKLIQTYIQTWMSYVVRLTAWKTEISEKFLDEFSHLIGSIYILGYKSWKVGLPVRIMKLLGCSGIVFNS